MSKASKSNASEHLELEGYEGHFRDFGPYTVGFETYTADAELAPLFVGLPDDHCQCPHMGYVIKGRLKFAFMDGTEELYSTRPVTRTTRRLGTYRRCTPGPMSWNSVRRPSCSGRSRWYPRTWRLKSSDDGQPRQRTLGGLLNESGHEPHPTLGD